MKKILVFLLFAFSVAAVAAPLIKKDFYQNGDMQATPSVGYSLDCDGNQKPNGLHAVILSAASGVGNVVTITENTNANQFPASRTWITTIDTSISNRTEPTCAQMQP